MMVILPLGFTVTDGIGTLDPKPKHLVNRYFVVSNIVYLILTLYRSKPTLA